MAFIEPRVSEQRARAFFRRRRWGNLWGLLRPRTRRDSQNRQLPRVELIWLPYYRIPIRVRSGKGPGETTVSVEAHSGAFALFQMGENLVDGLPDGERFEPQLSHEEAIKTGRDELHRSIMRRRGQRYKPVVEEALGIDHFYYPFWIYYYERRKGRLDIQVQDALTGEPGGAKHKVGILTAFLAAQHAKEGRTNVSTALDPRD